MKEPDLQTTATSASEDSRMSSNIQTLDDARPSVTQLKKGLHRAPSSHDDTPLFSRRGFLFGAAGVGVVAAAGAVAYGAGIFSQSENNAIEYLEVSKDAMTSHIQFDSLDTYTDMVHNVKSIDVPTGTLLHVNDDSVAACLLRTKTGSPLTQAGLLFLGSGELTTMVAEPIGKTDGFEILDVRATSDGMIWTEANIMQGRWRIYGAPLSNGQLGTAQLLDEGDSTYETPTLGIAAGRALWQKIPNDTMDLENPSQLMAASFDGSASTCLYKMRRRFGTPLWTDGTIAVITPREDTPTVYYTLTCIDCASGAITDTLTLPTSMRPLEAAYGKTGFMFSFPDIYNYGDGISNLGTYVPFKKPEDGNYSAVPWFGFARTPSAAPAWCGDLLIVKSTYSVCAVDLENRTYCAIDVENGAEGYGDYLVSTGSNPTFATYTNIDHTPVGEKAIHTGRIRLWQQTDRSKDTAQAQQA